VSVPLSPRAARRVEQGGAGGGERHPARPGAPALEQREADVALEAADLLAERRLREAEPARRAAEVELLGHGDEVREAADRRGDGVVVRPVWHRGRIRKSYRAGADKIFDVMRRRA
jgi:hypothetical protein